MKVLTCLIVSATLFFSIAHAQEPFSNSNNTCPGVWTIHFFGTTSVRNADNTVLPLTAETTFFDCQKKQFDPNQSYHGKDVEIECLQSEIPGNLPAVEKVFFICK